jgi:hypothetical protein
MSFGDDTGPLLERADPHRCECGLRYTEDEFCALRCPGVMQLESGFPIEMRDCLCGSTIARVLHPVTADVLAFLEREDRERDAA